MQLTHVKAMVFSGFSWLTIGFFLMLRGMSLLAPAKGASKEDTVILWLFGALLVGFLKGRFVLTRAAKRIAARILSLPSPLSFKHLYNKRYLLVLLVMVSLGVCFRFLGLPDPLRGAIDLAIGSALINGAMAYFREAQAVKSRVKGD